MMMANWNLLPFPVRTLGVYIACALGFVGYYASAEEVQFNTDVLDVKDRQNIDLGQFSRGGYIMPGNYIMLVRINKQELPEQSVIFYPAEDDAKDSTACISPSMVEQFGLKPDMKEKLTWWHQGECLSLKSLPGMSTRGDLGSASLTVSLPQAYLEYSADNWDPPSRWDNGVPGLLLDYYLNAQTQRQQQRGEQKYNVSGNGTIGGNLGAWRLRADWQTRLDHTTGSGEGTRQSWDWSRYYAYRALPRMGAQLSVGENYLYSDIFDSFRFTGASLTSDDSMLPPNLRGYAPEVTGVARTNAKVIISQQGRVLYETQVASGPFRIQDINDAVTGQLDVRVEEQDGSVQEFKIDTASIPYLTRPGTVRYKVASGRPSDWKHNTNGPLFATGEFSWGISNGWSLYGGGVAGGDYNAVAVGLGRDLMMFGALSFDVTQSRARLNNQWENGTLTGGSYRLSYSKSFDEFDSQVTFAGYRFSERNYMSMSEYLDVLENGIRTQSSKEMYTISYSQQLRDLGVSAYLNYNHQTYWNSATNDRYTLTLSRNFDIGQFRNISLSLTGYRNKYYGANDDGMYLSLSLPWGGSGSISYSGSYSRTNNSHQVSYYDRLKNGDSYQLSSGISRDGGMASGYYSHQGDMAQIDANASYQEGRYSSVGLSLQGGATATLEGAALHRSGMIGGIRLLLDTDGVADIPISGYGPVTRSNRFGKAVVTDVNSYYRNKISIDVNELPENAEATRSVVQATLTEGAIGYRKFEVIAGEKAMAVIRLADGTTPPFGATVQNPKKQNVGIIGDDGSVYLSGINPEEEMTVRWSGQVQCVVTLPAQIPRSDTSALLLPCRLLPTGKEAD
ncbi:PapC/FimD family outer membrane usher protein [Erwinia persicina]|uniref:outer membrane usher protein n=1 Tax=Erwinia persicina TaxID=55211 RepID=UPI000E4BB301|nr:outer membrane usher protein [Erwinia persicina]AXU96061.1 PapC/FimD family outer membrane usher protein [Erwinia persicina]